DGQTLTKSFSSEEAARKEMEKLIKEKLAKGYIDATESGTDAAGSASSDGSIPLIAFSSINRREEISHNAGTFIGKRVVDYDSEITSNDVIQLLASKKDRLSNLAAIYIGDITSEENEISWIHQSDLSPLLEAFPKLQLLRSRGGDGLEIKSPNHQNLRGLAIE